MAKLFGNTLSDAAEAPQGIVGSPTTPISLPQGFTLPSGKTASISGTLSASGTTNLAATNISGLLTATGNVVLGTNGSNAHTINGTMTINHLVTMNSLAFAGSNNTVLSFHSAGSFVGTLTGCATAPTTTFYYVRIGNMVVLGASGSLTGTSTTTSMTITGLPAHLYPASNKIVPHIVLDAGVGVMGRMDIDASGLMTFYSSPDGAAMTGSGIKGVYGLFGVYTVD